LQLAALFKVNTGMRQKEVCQLRWEWEQRVPELDTPEIKRTVFVLPEWVTKNKEARVVVLNDVAQRIVDELRGQHPTYVFIWEDRKGRARRFCRLNNSGWKAARRRAAVRYQKELGRPAPDGFRRVRIHDLKHTCGRRLRAAGVSLEDRQDILAHKAGRITTHYSAPEIGNLVGGSEPDSKLTRNSRESRSTVGRVTCKSLKVFGGKGGTRTRRNPLKINKLLIKNRVKSPSIPRRPPICRWICQ
jgi:integrase